jgi:hypothetical protein
MLLPDISAQLNFLRRLGDIETIGSGFYLPVPTYLVPFGDWAILVSGLPVQELRRLYGEDVLVPGLARVVRNSTSVTAIPCRPSADWLRTPRSTETWTDDLIRGTRFIEPQGCGGLDIYNTSRSQGPLGWKSIDQVSRHPQCTCLARRRHTTGERSYYLLRLGARGINAMAELELKGSEIRRLQLGVRALASEPLRFSITDGIDENCVVRAPSLLPDPETLFLDAVGREQRQSDGGTRWISIPKYARETAMKLLISLGLRDEPRIQHG